ncbi:ATP-binding protein [Streptomyces halstedii]|uniref:ATP-binding protein n=1 Tax=Streptomyces halstedii TaxID=1944 RepID=UPI001EF33670|nr:ATP-binding protein [Streptomyces halstedii]
MTSTFTVPQQSSAQSPLNIRFERCPAPASNELSEADAAWPCRLRRIIRARLIDWQHTEIVETAELLLTELATNALRHSHGREINVCVRLTEGRCLIAVAAGSADRPRMRHAGPDDEGGRGLFLVDALAESWGVSPDGTTAWCTLPITEGPPEMDRTAAPVTVLRETRFPLPPDPSALRRARIKGRTHLTLLCWPGNQHAATDVLYVLVHNALAHGITPGEPSQNIDVWLRVTRDHQLLIDVIDPNPDFPDFERAVAGELGHGLRGAQQLGAAISYIPGRREKTVRATLQPGQVEP